MLAAARAARSASGADHATLVDSARSRAVLEVRITRDEFFALTETLVARTLAAVRKVLRDAKVGKDEVQGVVMVGGSTRMPRVQVPSASCSAARR